MTTQFDSKESAIMTGLHYAGRDDLYKDTNGLLKPLLEDILKNSEIKILNDNISQFGYVHEDCTMIEFSNSKGKISRIATTKFRDGFDLWLIDPESGYSMRV